MQIKPSITLSQLPLSRGPEPEPFGKRVEGFVNAKHHVLIGVNLKDHVRLLDIQKWINA